MRAYVIHGRVRLAAAAAAALLVAPVPARAQEGPAPSPAPAAGQSANGDAAARFKQGLKLFDEGDYALALVEFERAYELAPNYRGLYNIGLVNAQLGRYAAAARALERYLRDGGTAIGPERRKEVEGRLADLKLRTATLEVSVNVAGSEVSLDNKPLDMSQLHGPMLIDAGEHTLRASAAGYEPAVRALTLAGADTAVVHFDLVASKGTSLPPQVPPVARRHLFVPGLIGTSVLAAGAITSGVVMLGARANLNSLQNTVGSSEMARSSVAAQVNTAALVADVLTGLTVVGGGVTLYFSLRTDDPPRSARVSLSPNHVALLGTF
jgi:hypothetical protein